MLGHPYKRKLSIQSVDLNSGSIVIFDETVPEELRSKVILSSASIPSFFPPVEIDEMQLVDGGTFQNISIGDPIDRCREEVNDDSEIVVDLILCFDKVVDVEKWDLEDTDWYDAFTFYRRKK